MVTHQYVIFTLEQQEYGINITYTQEILRVPQITNIPNMPAFIEGVINLRGRVIPVINPKKKFGLAQTEISNDHRLLILDLEEMNIGIIVDDVSEVVTINEQAIENLSMEIVTLGGNSVQGIAKIDQRLVLLLNALEFKNEIFKLEIEGKFTL
ncbi:chemotaxis protein CheW [Desulfitobacterium sp. AusDCA]|uniref:chemotaxis protein CheW n=1 Tax=Desulfitobacterium sp. AusDCA TaxID=3240383 RepID=UPI003DA75C5D